ncbi:hypothetical protein J6590_016326 [Homalodisca vitripennis]|nr:hypothetical protein J6590_016326 [Homalodisca vitripennis]
MRGASKDRYRRDVSYISRGVCHSQQRVQILIVLIFNGDLFIWHSGRVRSCVLVADSATLYARIATIPICRTGSGMWWVRTPDT